MARIAILTTSDATPVPVVNALATAFPDHQAFIEPAEPKSVFLRRRARKVGWFSMLHQLPVMSAGKLAGAKVRKRMRALEERHGVSFAWLPGLRTETVSSGNGADFIAALRAFGPDILVLAGSRMLTKATLAAIPCPVVNFHAGINPAYRGLNGGYWALAQNDPANYGATMHFVDAGVDTGAIIAQARFTPDPADTILTHQKALSAQSPAMAVAAVAKVLEGRAMPLQTGLPTRQWFHPALIPYVWRGLTRKVW